MGRRKRRHNQGRDGLPVFLLAFGLGLFLAMCCSVKLALLVAAIVLIYVGITCC